MLLDANDRLAIELNADGVEVPPDLKSYKVCRASLGDNMAVGVNCAEDRHMAMELAEAGADYVRISATANGPGDEPLIAWWAQLFEVPCVAAGPLEPSLMSSAVRMGADFVQPADDMWLSPQSATQTIEQAMQAIGAAGK